MQLNLFFHKIFDCPTEFWILFRIESIFSCLLDPDPYSEYRSGRLKKNLNSLTQNISNLDRYGTQNRIKKIPILKIYGDPTRFRFYNSDFSYMYLEKVDGLVHSSLSVQQLHQMVDGGQVTAGSRPLQQGFGPRHRQRLL